MFQSARFAHGGSKEVSKLEQWFELDRTSAGSNLRSMEGLRGLAVILVFFVHYTSLMETWLLKDSMIDSFATALKLVGNIGVDLFFVLSGYLIYGSLMNHAQPFWRFMKRRIHRIYPTFLVVLAIYVGLSIIDPAAAKLPEGFLSKLFYIVQNVLLLPGIFPIPPLISVAWSLSYEMLFYLLTPAAIYFFRLRTRSTRSRILTLALVGIAISIALYWFDGPIRMLMFFAGMFVFEAREEALDFNLPTYTGGLALVIALLCPIAFAYRFPVIVQVYTLSVCFFIVCLISFSNPRSFTARLFSYPPLRWLGNMSYSYYLIHGLTLKILFWIMEKVHPPTATLDSDLFSATFWLALGPFFALTLVTGAVLFLLVEKPLSMQKRT